MSQTLPLESMTISEKLSVLEELWDDLCHSEKDIPVPAWHEKILRERQQRVDSGQAKFYSLDEAKELVRKRIR